MNRRINAAVFVALLACVGTPLRAAAPELPVDAPSTHDAARARALLMPAFRRFPRLFEPGVVKRFVVDPAAFADAPSGLASAARFVPEDKKLFLHLAALDALSAAPEGGPISPAKAAESAVIHELLRALSYGLDGLDWAHERGVSENRLRAFKAAHESAPVKTALEARQRRLQLARLRLRIEQTGLTQKEYLDGARGMMQAIMSDDYDNAARLPLEEARRLVADEEDDLFAADQALADLLAPPLAARATTRSELARQLAAYRAQNPAAYETARRAALKSGKAGALARMQAAAVEEDAALSREHKIPRGKLWSPEVPSDGEAWFARIGQCAFYAEEPSAHLTEKELKFWRDMERYLARKGRFPKPAP